jgi:hypothetical protein
MKMAVFWDVSPCSSVETDMDVMFFPTQSSTVIRDCRAFIHNIAVFIYKVFYIIFLLYRIFPLFPFIPYPFFPTFHLAFI